MLTSQQIKIADFLLKHIASRGGKSNKDDYPEELLKQGFNEYDCDILEKILIDEMGLIRYYNAQEYVILLTPEGNKAAEIGVQAYLHEIEEVKNLEKKSKEASIKGIETANKNSKRAILIAIFVPVLITLFQIYFNQIKDRTTNGNNDSGVRHQIDFSDFPFNGSDSLFVEKIKNSLKHDSIFLNEVKHIIEKDTPKNNH